MRRFWQKGMIALARSSRLKHFMQSNRGASKLATRYVGGDNVVEALDCANRLSRSNIRSSLFYLGEYVDTHELVDRNITSINRAIDMISLSELDGHLSVDPTQVGCSIDWDKGAAAFWPIAEALKKAVGERDGVHCLMIDMEDDSVVERTVALYHALHADGYPVALTLQAYLKHTEGDLEKVIRQGGKVRLVKGAFVAGSDIAHVGNAAVKANYYRLVDRMLSKEALEYGFYPIFATHDHEIHGYAIETARANGWPQCSYEIEMLYGARDDVAEELSAHGERVRLYLPFGADWWPYAIRRIGENPKNLNLLLRSLI
ncbi:proline dehydrogenase family protein [Cohaesibacter intestini]|uniref:proline dehydrogenase family protein n=1 Tax=Cohaesibacter intestini TaxID=2211145 RepID=UPI000DEA10A4|nr:proline dehydrogenase family protein [Cohaesibacter intestini]